MKYIIKNQCDCLKIRKALIKHLLVEDEFELLDVIFNNIILLKIIYKVLHYITRNIYFIK